MRSAVKKVEKIKPRKSRQKSREESPEKNREKVGKSPEKKLKVRKKSGKKLKGKKKFEKGEIELKIYVALTGPRTFWSWKFKKSFKC